MRQEKICETTIPREGRTAALDTETRSTRGKIKREREKREETRKYFSFHFGRVSSDEENIKISKITTTTKDKQYET